ncbi:MAG TPA: hypothetical protein DEQ55_15675 [Pseudomonas sp.]|nr:hypothetical protein [Pseudomonas sp.]
MAFSRGIGDLLKQGLALVASAIIVEQRGAGLGAALLGALAAALQSAELYFQGVGVRWVRLPGLMRLQPLLAPVKSLAATGKLFGVGAHALPRLGEQGVVQLQ